MLLKQFILLAFQTIGCTDAVAEVSCRDSRSPPSPRAVVWLGAPVAVQHSGDPVGCHLVPEDPTVYRRAIAAVEHPLRSALEAGAGPHRDPLRSAEVGPRRRRGGLSGSCSDAGRTARQ